MSSPTNQQEVELKVTQDADVTIIEILTRRIPVDAGESFEQNVVRTVNGLADPKVLLDFRDVDFISSAILGKLIKLNGRVNDRAGQLKISGLSPRIAEVFRITGLDKLFDIYDDRDKAIKAFK
jgi:anti-sigma B factor antagonist